MIGFRALFAISVYFRIDKITESLIYKVASAPYICILELL